MLQRGSLKVKRQIGLSNTHLGHYAPVAGVANRGILLYSGAGLLLMAIRVWGKKSVDGILRRR